MDNNPDTVQDHYGSGDLLERILTALESDGKERGSLQASDLYGVDQLHIGGIHATRKLISQANTSTTDKVLDVGCGIGGTARLLATEVGCSVTGIDLTAEYCRVAEELTRLVGLADKVAIQEANALNISAADNSFDQVWCQHVNMNISDKHGLLTELVRVLKPGGFLVLHEVFAGEQPELSYPVPWAADPSISFLCTAQDYRDKLRELSMSEVYRHNHSAEALDWWEKRAAAIENGAPGALGPPLIFGPISKQFGPNLIKNLKNDCIRVFEMIYAKNQ